MTARLARIYRHPIKGHGAEALEAADLEAGRTLPWDRTWAVAHEASRTDGTDWAPCANFSRGAKAPQLMAIGARLDEAAGQVTLTHPDRPDLTFSPDNEGAALIDWVRPLMPGDRAASTRIVRAPGRGMTDSAFPSISLLGLASLAALSDRVGQNLSPLRFRGNFWIEGLAPFAEFDWVGQKLRLGRAVIEVRERITRCLATAANPETGERDADTLGALQAGWGHKQFGVYAEVIEGGRVALGDAVEAL
ncbi:molybdenum cofactor biosysynthesis protein [Rhodovulum viride]|uniref:Molybdenum cofactor biosysynthesis protein n=1 Tax=Rhodovulum viride TaxID=1231134 RepID=A0ABX9DCB4_9RHOB|nr:MOSC N-terminal beta barrel domain-containing protein [Rhodovulum viride]RAP39748.1 molybdenum cofactor biosysynthesis protein [Rhodovulum viride]